ncbi:hypothetical protein ACFBZI_11290 [Moraxella sp. ZJ142]|uniref:hypothetical protein n=1 Tax=Moraxella marmotae TaxID=3344520 RepID=UPI0035D3F693
MSDKTPKNHNAQNNERQSSLVTRGVSKVVTLPLGLMFNRGSRRTASAFVQDVKTKPKSKVYCPYCADGFLHLQNAQDNTAKGEWQCDHCGFEVETADKKSKTLVNLIAKEGSQWYQQGRAAGVGVLSAEEREIGVKRLLLRSRICGGVALVLACVAIKYITMSAYLIALLALGFALLFGLNFLAQGFAAWKLHNDLLYHKDGKALLRHWLSQGSPWKVSDYQP